MSDEIKQWEYHVQTVGSFFGGVKAEALEALLNEWGEEGWEVIAVHLKENSNSINVIAKRPLTERVKRLRTMPRMNRP